MYYITGDTHGDFSRIQNFCSRVNTTKEDVIIILGDAGLNFWLNKSDIKKKENLASYPITLFMIHGNHEERPYNIEDYEEREWHGGKVYVQPQFPSLIFAKDGEVYDLGGKQVMVIGGAYSVDKEYRLLRHIPWFESEQPSPAIKEYVESQLNKYNWKIDYIFSHTCPYQYRPIHLFLSCVDQKKVDNSTELWLEDISYKLDYKKWYFGHYHSNEINGKTEMLYDSIKLFAE